MISFLASERSCAWRDSLMPQRLLEVPLMAIPVKEVKAPVVLLFANDDAVTYRAVLERWQAGTTESRVKKAVAAQLKPRAVS